MKTLKQFPDDFGKPYITSFHFLDKFNVRYLEEDKSFVKKYWRFIYILPATLIQITALGTHMAVLLKTQDIIQFASMLPPFLVDVQSILKALVLIPRTAELSSFIRELGGTLWRTKFTESQSKLKNAQLWRLNFCNRAYYYVTKLGSMQFLLSPLLETLVRRYILQQDCELLLPAASSYPFDPTKNWMIYIPVYIFQFYTMFLLSYIYIGTELILITSCALLGIEFLMLKEDLLEIQPDTEVKETDGERHKPTLKEFVQRHQKLIRLSQQLDNIFNRMIFIDLLFVGMTTCAFRFAGEFARGPLYMLNSYLGVAASLTNVFCLCYYGEILTGTSAEIADCAYKNQWYKGDKPFAKAIWLIIKISQKPCCITSLKYSVVSLNLFSKVVSTTWSYFSLMNTVYSED